MSISQIKNHSLSAKLSHIHLTSLLIASAALLNFSTNAAIPSKGAILNKAIECEIFRPCNTTIPGKSGYAHGITLGGCNSDTYHLCGSGFSTGSINVKCGNSDHVILRLTGDNALCNVNENMYINSSISDYVSYWAYIYLFPGGIKGDKGDPGTISWSTAIISGTISGLCVVSVVGLITLVLYKIGSQNNQESLLANA